MTRAGSQQASVNITMVTFNRREATLRSIRSIAETAGHPYELTVVDNGSSDATPADLRALAEEGLIHRLILNGANLGVAYAANQGWWAGTKEYYLKVDNDIIFTRNGWLTKMVEACDRLPDLGAVAYNFEPIDYPVREVSGVRVRPKQGNLGGACIMVPDRVHRRVGYWCEDYWPYGLEDGDLYFRLRTLGLRSYYLEDLEAAFQLPDFPRESSTASTVDPGEAQRYRAFKDRWNHVYGGRRGLARVNLALYRTHLRSPYFQHGVPFRPSLPVLVFVALRFLRWDPWKAAASLQSSSR